MSEPVVKTGKTATADEREELAKLVRDGQQVNPAGLSERVENAHHLSFVHKDGHLIAAGAVKDNPDYQASIARKSGVKLPSGEYLGEVGYLHTALAHRRQGHGKAVLTSLLEAAGDKSLFATVQSKNVDSQGLLERNGFVRVGKAWKSLQADDDVNLYIRPGAGKAE